MKTILSLLLTVCIGVCAHAQRDPFKVEVTKTVISQNDKGVNILSITIKNTGRFLYYPMVQARHGNDIIANKEGRFSLYGIMEGVEEVFEFPVELPAGKRRVALDILLGEGESGDVVGTVECLVPNKPYKALQAQVLKAELYKGKDGGNMIRIVIRNGGEFLSYPVAQARHDGEIIANEDGRFDLYGIAENRTETFEFPITLPEGKQRITLDILLGEGGAGVVIGQVACEVPK